ncbi:hypothetical protein BY458DRAFT_549608 [Sporodiniella umbellata]|nr:hypothetical protein BY458DRAFT_549608 [Sporodiniella umbellata]
MDLGEQVSATEGLAAGVVAYGSPSTGLLRFCSKVPLLARAFQMDLGEQVSATEGLTAGVVAYGSAVDCCKLGFTRCSPQELEEYLGGEALLEGKYTSDEEPHPDIPGDFVTLRPSWRSEKTNAFLELLDKKGFNQSKAHKTRHVSSVNKLLTERQEIALPRWAYQ